MASVVRGQVLARLDPGGQLAKVAKARAALSIAEVGIARSAAIHEKSVAVLAQRELVVTRRLALTVHETVRRQALEAAQRDAAVARADVTIAGVEIDVASAPWPSKRPP